MPLRIAVDLDGTIADMDGALAREGERLFGTSVTRCIGQIVDAMPDAGGPEVTDPATSAGDVILPQVKLDLNARQTRQIWKHVERIENFWEALDEIEPGVTARLGTLATQRRWEIIFLTRRPATAGATAQVQTQRWLESKGFPLPSVYVVQGSRGRIAAALSLDIVIDDRPENCLDVVVDSRARAILVWRGDEKQLPEATRRLGIGTVKSVSDCLDILVEIDSAATDKPGIMERLKRMLGLNS